MWAQPSFQAASSVGNHALAVSSTELPVSRRRCSRLWDRLVMQTPEASRHALTVGQEIQLPVFTTVNSGNSSTVDSSLGSTPAFMAAFLKAGGWGAAALRRAAPSPTRPLYLASCQVLRECPTCAPPADLYRSARTHRR